DTTHISDDVTTLQASTTLASIIRTDESRNQCTNRISFYMTSEYPSSFKSLRLINPANEVDETLVIVTFKGLSEFESLLNDTHPDLAISSASATPIFHRYDSQAIKLAENSRSIIVTDIPLFLEAQDLKAAFAKFGTIQKFSIRTRITLSIKR